MRGGAAAVLDSQVTTSADAGWILDKALMKLLQTAHAVGR